MATMTKEIRRIDATTAEYSEFADVMEKNQPVECVQIVMVQLAVRRYRGT